MIGAVDLMAVVVAGVLMLFACCAYHLSFCMHCPSLAPKSQCTNTKQGLTRLVVACGAVVQVQGRAKCRVHLRHVDEKVEQLCLGSCSWGGH